MPELADYEVAASSTFLSAGKLLSTTFNSGGRNAGKRAYAQISALGGLKTNAKGMGFRMVLNGTSIGTHYVSRFQEGQNFVIYDQMLVEFSSDLLKTTGDNTLVLVPQYSDQTDYCWIGTAIVHFRQNS
jgi:hypothetical protein